MEVEVVSKKLVAPSSNPEDHPPNITLSCLDHLSPPFYYSIIFYYHHPQNRDTNLKKEGLSLEKSLCDTLTVFYPLAGRLNDEKTSIDCNDHGVDYWEARVNAGLSDLLLQQPVDAKLLSRFVPPRPMRHSPTTPLVFIQVSLFECGGLAIGLRVSHLAADMHSLTLFVRGWANSCSSQSPPPLTPSFNSILPPRDGDIPQVWKPVNPRRGGPSKDHVVSTRLVFGGEALSQLKASVGKGTASRVQVVTGLIWKTLTKIDESNHGFSRPFVASHTFNARGKMPSLPDISESCFGNFWWPVVAPLINDPAKSNIDDMVGVVRDAIECTKLRAKGVVCDSDVVLMARAGWREMKECRKDGPGVCDFTSWCRMHHYEVDFGWGKPSWVSCVPMPRDGYIIFLDTEDGDGIEAWVSLYADTMLLFRQHPHIQPFTAHCDKIAP